MFTTASVKMFRGFSDFTIGHLEQVNLVVGPNDVGKTALLEALLLLLGEGHLGNIVKLSALRGVAQVAGDPESISEWFWSPLFHGLDPDATIEIQAQDDRRGLRKVELKLVPRESAPVLVDDKVARGLSGETNVFSSKALELRFDDGSGDERVYRMVIDGGIPQQVQPLPPQPSIRGYLLSARYPNPLNEDAQIVGELLRTKVDLDLADLLKIVEPSLSRVVSIPGPGGALLYGDVGLSRLQQVPRISRAMVVG